MSEKQKEKTAVVIGAGTGGISTAARLAKAGFKVTVLEKNDFTGGRCSLIHHDGYRFDQGPSLLLLPRLFHEAYADLDTSMDAEGVKILKCEPNYNIWFGDGEKFIMSSDQASMKTEIEKWEGEAGYLRYLDFLKEAHIHYEASVREVLHKNFLSLFAIFRPSFFKHIINLHPFVSAWSRASLYFYTERLRRVFTFATMYMGMSPFDAPATYSLLQYTELAEGIWYPIGGFWKTLDALVKVGERFGVEYRLNTGVKSIKLSADQKTATGVVLENGESLDADVVVCGADLVYAYNNLLPQSTYAKALSKRSASCSSISFYWALDQKIPQLTAHNIFLADEYKESFDSIFEKQLIPEQPSFYVNVPSRVDPSAAPEGKDTVVVLVPVGHLISSDKDSGHRGGSDGRGVDPKNPQDWQSMVAGARKKVIETIQARTGADLGPHIIYEEVNNPKTWLDKFNLDKGAILGLSHSFFNVLSFRPKTIHASIKNLYFVGASTHPGTGVPICLAGSKITSEQILDDQKMRIPWSKGTSGIKTSSKALDRPEPPPGIQISHVLMLLSGLFLVIFSRFYAKYEQEQKDGWGNWNNGTEGIIM